MKSKQSRALQAFRRVEAWFADHPAVIPATGSSATALANQVTALSDVITRMTTQGTEQVTQKGQATLAAKDEDALYEDLRKVHLRAIVKVARALRGQVPGVGVIKMPAANLSSEGLVTAAEALYPTASVYKDVFVEHGLPQDFLDQLASASSGLKASIDARGVAISKRTGATSSVGGDYKLGLGIVEVIDASLTHALKADAATLASWRQAKRITLKSGVPRGSAVSTPPTNAAAPAMSGGAPIALVTEPAVPAEVPSTHTVVTSTPMPETAAA